MRIVEAGGGGGGGAGQRLGRALLVDVFD